MRYWVSWYQPTKDYRPLTYPPNEAILGWWCSGASTLCALVSASDKVEAGAAITKDWPEAKEWRFVYEKGDKWLPGDRFPLKDWMRDRFRKAGVEV